MTINMGMSKLDIVGAFIARLGDPTKFYYTGQVIELPFPTGMCVCGHQIKYEYMISDGNQTVAVGSECINHFREYNQKLYEELMKAKAGFDEKKKEDARKAREARRNAEVEKLEAEHKAIQAEIKSMFPDGYPWLPAELYWDLKENWRPKQYKRSTSYIKWYKENTPKLAKALEGLRPIYEQWKAKQEQIEEEPVELATEKQIKYLRYLVNKTNAEKPDWDTLSKDAASNMISNLKYSL